MPADLPALWRSTAWRARLEEWLLPTLADAGLTVTGPLVQERVRYWSTILHVETDAGRVWVKDNAPSQGFEAALVEVVDGLLPGLCAPLVGVDVERGWLATRDLGLPLWHDETAPPAQEWEPVLGEFAQAQRTLVAHADAVLSAGVPRFPERPDDVVAWVVDLVEQHRALPADDPRRPTDAESAAIDAGLGRIADAAALLADSGLPSTLQHNDLHLGNAFRRPGGGVTYIDLGDALWAHPLTTLRIPMWILRHRYDLAEDDPCLVRTRDAGLEPWLDRLHHDELVALLPAADRISCLHRADSWFRLQGDVPPEVVDEDLTREALLWVVDAAAPNPYASAVAR